MLYMGGKRISTDQQGFVSFNTIPTVDGSCRILSALINNRFDQTTSGVKIFTNYIDISSTSDIQFSEEPSFITIFRPFNHQTHVNPNPTFLWQGEGKVFKIEISSGSFWWSIYTTSVSFDLPQLPYVDLMDYEIIYLTISTRSDQDEQFVNIDPSENDCGDFTKKRTDLIFYTGEEI